MTGNIRHSWATYRFTRERIVGKTRRRTKGFDVRVQSLAREIPDPGDDAAILRYDPSRSRVVLVLRFRLPAFLRRRHESLIEVCAGKLEGEDAEAESARKPRKIPDFWCEIRAASSKLT